MQLVANMQSWSQPMHVSFHDLYTNAVQLAKEEFDDMKRTLEAQISKLKNAFEGVKVCQL